MIRILSISILNVLKKQTCFHLHRLPSFGSQLGPLDGRCSAAADLRNFNKTLRLTYTICGFFSLFFLAITLFLYLTLPSLRNLQVRAEAEAVAEMLLIIPLISYLIKLRLWELISSQIFSCHERKIQ